MVKMRLKFVKCYISCCCQNFWNKILVEINHQGSKSWVIFPVLIFDEKQWLLGYYTIDWFQIQGWDCYTEVHFQGGSIQHSLLQYFEAMLDLKTKSINNWNYRLGLLKCHEIYTTIRGGGAGCGGCAFVHPMFGPLVDKM